MRILVGTLRTIENEFDQCCDSIRRQTYPATEHLVITGLGNREAHAKLFEHFMAHRSQYDLLVKIDADMVLCSNEFFARLVERFTAEPDLAQLQVWVHDWFTDRLIGGMNIYRNTCRWNLDGEDVFVESSKTVSFERGYRVTDKEVLAPAAIHCGDPSPFQAFHFGLHKAVKVREALSRSDHARAVEHMANVETLWTNFQRQRDRRLLLACLGAEMALEGKFGPRDLDYSEPAAKRVCDEFESWTDAAIEADVRRRRRATTGFAAGNDRLEWLRGGGVRFVLRRLVPAPLRRILRGKGLAK